MLKYVDIDNLLISGIASSSEKSYKYFIGYKGFDYKIKILPIMFPKTNTYVKCYDGETKWMIFWIKDNGLLKKYSNIWNIVSKSIKKELHSKPIYNNKKIENQNKILQ